MEVKEIESRTKSQLRLDENKKMPTTEVKNNIEKKQESERPRPASYVMETTVYNQKGESMGKIKLPENVFGLRPNADLVHQVVVSMTSSARNPIAHAKTRGEVRGGGKKPWKQKGTGQARHGSTRSPIWVGGGVTHGPRNDKNYDRKVNRKMKLKALYTILSQKMRDGEILFVDEFKLKEAKTKYAVEVLSNLKKISSFEKLLNKKTNIALIALGELDKDVMRSFRNIGNISMDEVRNINPVSLLNHKTLVLVNPEASIRSIQGRGGIDKEQLVKREEKTESKKVVKKAKTSVKKPSRAPKTKNHLSGGEGDTEASMPNVPKTKS